MGKVKVKVSCAEKKIIDTLENIQGILSSREFRDTNIFFMTIPEAGGTFAFQVGTTRIDFSQGIIFNPNGSRVKLKNSLAGQNHIHLHSISVDTDQNIILQIGSSPARTITANFSTQIPYLAFTEVYITCSVISNISIFACTNPSAVIGQFKAPVAMTQTNIDGDQIESTNLDTPITSLLSNMDRIRNQIVTITGEAWLTVSHPINTIWGKFNATTGHKHTGAADDAPQLTNAGIATGASIDWAKVNKTGSNVSDLAAHDHTALTSIGTNTHDQIDTHIAATASVHNFDGSGNAPAQSHGNSRHTTAFGVVGGSSYTGNGATNRAIPHGLGVAPKLVIIHLAGNSGRIFMISQGEGYIHYLDSAADAGYTVTSADATNFYVGNASDYNRTANANLGAYEWEAWG